MSKVVAANNWAAGPRGILHPERSMGGHFDHRKSVGPPGCCDGVAIGALSSVHQLKSFQAKGCAGL